MNARIIAAELNAGFQSALMSASMPEESRTLMVAILSACANNAAQALADRTISNGFADDFSGYGCTIEEALTQWMDRRDERSNERLSSGEVLRGVESSTLEQAKQAMVRGLK